MSAPDAAPAPPRCSFCARQGIHRWFKWGLWFCAHHWSDQLEAVASDQSRHPEKYREDSNGRKQSPSERPQRRKRTTRGDRKASGERSG